VESDRAHRLANVLARRRARFLLAHVDDLFA
jgi:predicted anti-sigma-YlaC factor YlaD